MTTDTLSSTSDHLSVAPDATETSRQLRERRIPLTIPSDQEYYWHYEWQQGEREALAAMDAGDSIVFDSDDPEDVVRWLQEPDADEDGADADPD